MTIFGVGVLFLSVSFGSFVGCLFFFVFGSLFWFFPLEGLGQQSNPSFLLFLFCFCFSCFFYLFVRSAQQQKQKRKTREEEGTKKK